MTSVVVPFDGWGGLSQAWDEQAWNTAIITTKTVTVVSAGDGNKYFIDGVRQATLV